MSDEKRDLIPEDPGSDCPGRPVHEWERRPWKGVLAVLGALPLPAVFMQVVELGPFDALSDPWSPWAIMAYSFAGFLAWPLVVWIMTVSLRPLPVGRVRQFNLWIGRPLVMVVVTYSLYSRQLFLSLISWESVTNRIAVGVMQWGKMELFIKSLVEGL